MLGCRARKIVAVASEPIRKLPVTVEGTMHTLMATTAQKCLLPMDVHGVPAIDALAGLSDHDAASAARDAISAEHDRLRAALDEAAAERQELAAEHDRLTGAFEATSSEHDTISAEHDRLRAALEQATAERDELRRELDHARAALGDATRDRETVGAVASETER